MSDEGFTTDSTRDFKDSSLDDINRMDEYREDMREGKMHTNLYDELYTPKKTGGNMSLIAKKTGDSFDPIPEDIYSAVCYAVYDLGKHYNELFGKIAHKIVIVFELPDCRIEVEKDGEKLELPRAISKRYTLSLHERSILRKDLESWRGKSFKADELESGFDLKKLLGKFANVQIMNTEKNEKVYSNIATITKYKGENLKQENKLSFFSFDEGIEFPEDMPEWVMNICKEADEYKMISNVKQDIENNDSPIIEDEEEDNLPF